MKSLIKNYMELLTIEKLNQFGIKNNIYLNDVELNYIFNLIQSNWENILIDDTKYLEELKLNINSKNYNKIKILYEYYKKRYKGYLF